jgi:predicted nuclease of predicted toxin-antitoxin system
MNMRILADENFPRRGVESLRRMGHDVVWVRTDAPGAGDEDVIAWAVRDKRVLLTLDKDFGELAFRAGLPADSGVVLVRGDPPLPGPVTSVVELLFRGEVDFTGAFVVVERARVRRRVLPRRS